LIGTVHSASNTSIVVLKNAPSTRRTHLSIHRDGFSIPVISCQSNNSLRKLLGVWLITQQADPTEQSQSNQPPMHFRRTPRQWLAVANLPSFMILALAVGGQVVFALEPLRTLDAIVLAQSRKVLISFCRLVLGQMFGRREV
jgi:hypothetical protein